MGYGRPLNKKAQKVGKSKPPLALTHSAMMMKMANYNGPVVNVNLALFPSYGAVGSQRLGRELTQWQMNVGVKTGQR